MQHFIEYLAANPYAQAVAIIVAFATGAEFAIRVLKVVWKFSYASVVDGIRTAVQRLRRRRREAYLLAARDLHIMHLAMAYKVINIIWMWLLLWLMFKIGRAEFNPLDPYWPDVVVLSSKVLLCMAIVVRIIDLWYYIVKVSRARVEVINNTVGSEIGSES